MPQNNDLLLTDATLAPTDDMSSKVVRTAIKIIEDSKQVMNNKLTDIDSIMRMFNDTFDLRLS